MLHTIKEIEGPGNSTYGCETVLNPLLVDAHSVSSHRRGAETCTTWIGPISTWQQGHTAGLLFTEIVNPAVEASPVSLAGVRQIK